MEILRNKKLIVLLPELEGKNSTTMTHLQGEMTIKYSDIVAKLGKPTSKGDGYKVSAEWDVLTPFGMGTIYDYKEHYSYCGRKEGSATKDITNWHIGGHNPETAKAIKSIFFK